MPRLEIELTSERPDGTWTWRAAGAKQPKGVITAGVVPGGCKVGDVLKAEAEVEIDGINVTSLHAPKAQAAKGPERLTLLSRESAPEGGVTSSLVEKRSRGREDRGPREGGDRGPRPGGPRSDRPGGPRREGPGREGPGRETGPRREGPGREGPGREGPGRERPPRREGGPDARTGPRPSQRDGRPANEGRPPREGGPPREGSPAREGRPAREPRTETRRPPRFQPGKAHRDAAVAALPEEQRPVAEQLLKGGIKAVRDALNAQGIDPGAMVTLAENLNPVLRAAEWRDRADAAMADLQAVPLRELRAIVTAAADAAKGEESKTLASKLKEALASRQEALRTEWVDGIKSAVEANRPLRALRQASRSASPASRIPAELAVQLAQAAGAALTAATPPQRWLDVLEAVVASPVSRTVKPEGLPENAPEELLAKARAAAGAVPALASLLGMSVPPPPPRRPVPPPPRQRPAARPARPAPAPRAAVPAEQAAAEQPPAEQPPAEQPPAEQPPAEQPPAPEAEATAQPETASEVAPEPSEVVPEPTMAQGEALEAPASADEPDSAVVGVLSDHIENLVVVEELDQTGDDVQA